MFHLMSGDVTLHYLRLSSGPRLTGGPGLLAAVGVLLVPGDHLVPQHGPQQGLDLEAGVDQTPKQGDLEFRQHV